MTNTHMKRMTKQGRYTDDKKHMTNKHMQEGTAN